MSGASCVTPSTDQRRGARFNNLITRYWRGEFPLWVSYWVFGLFGTVVVGVTALLVTGVLSRNLGYDLHAIFASLFVIWLCVFAIAAWQCVPVWTSAYGYKNLIAIYATFWVVWAWFTPWIAPTIIAATVHLVIVLFIGAIDRKDRVPPLETARACTRTNVVLVLFSAAFLALSILSGSKGDYSSYGPEWRAILEGHDPWDPNFGGNAYGPLFNVLAPLYWITPLAPKLLFAFAYLVFVIWLIKDFGARRGLVALSWPVVVFWLMNPFPWVEIAYYGHNDVLVALACVAAVHSREQNKDVASGTFLAIGVLLKYLPIVILPFLVFNERPFRFRLFICCAVLIITALLVSVLVWGESTFSPLIFATTREFGGSIYELLSSVYSPLRLFGDAPNVDWLEKPLGLTAGLGVFTWCRVRQIRPALSAVLAVLVTLLFYRVGPLNYQMVLFFLISYWAVSEWEQLKKHSVLPTLLIGYFGLLAIIDISILFGFESYSDYSVAVVLFKFLTGCALVAGLIQFSAGPLLFSYGR